jgi:hypothetical protein
MLIAAAFIVLEIGGPTWVGNALVAAILIISIPLMFLILQREWRKFWGR